MCAGLEVAEFSIPGLLVADIGVVGDLRRALDGATELGIEALTIGAISGSNGAARQARRSGLAPHLESRRVPPQARDAGRSETSAGPGSASRPDRKAEPRVNRGRAAQGCRREAR